MEISTSVIGEKSAAAAPGAVQSNDATIGAESLTGFCELVRELGGDPLALLHQAAIEIPTLTTPGAKISLRAATELLEDTARRLSRADFGLRLAERQNGLSILKPINLLIANAPTVGEAMRYCACYFQCYTSALHLQFTRDHRRQLYLFNIEFRSEEFADRRQITEQLVLLTVATNSKLTGGAVRAREVWFSHTRGGPTSTYAKRFGVPVRFGQPLDGVFYSESEVACKVINRDPSVFHSECEKQYPTELPSVVSEVYQAIIRTLADECCTREQVAALLGMHPRTLQRRLFGGGASFEELRDEVRRKLATRYLARKDLSLLDVVNRLGYSEPAVLSRSCRRWFDASPTQIRRNLIREERKRLEGLSS